MNSKIVLLTSDQPGAVALAKAARALARAILDHGIVLSGVIVERTPPAKSWKRSLRNFLGEELSLQLASLRWPADVRRLLLGEHELQRRGEARLDEALGQDARSFPSHLRILRTDRVNSEDAYRFLCNDVPDLVVTFATGLLKPRMLQIPRLGTINVHTSLLPDYRGFWPEFWQLYDRAYDKTGFSVHFIDEGVDTGDILHREHVPSNDDTDPFMLRTRNIIHVVRKYPCVIKDVLSGVFSRIPQPDPTTPVYRLKDVTMEKKAELFQRFADKLGWPVFQAPVAEPLLRRRTGCAFGVDPQREDAPVKGTDSRATAR
jgi:hypothetical protein